MAGTAATILLVGDDGLLGRALERALSSDGMRVLRGPEEASRGRPALVVLLDAGAEPALPSDERPAALVGLDELPLLVVDPQDTLADRLAAWRGPLAYIVPPFGGRQFLAAVRAQLARAASA